MKLKVFDQLYPLGTLTNRRIFTRVFQVLMRIIEFYVGVRDKYCAAKVLRQSETGDITSLFIPHNRDPEKFEVPPTWRRSSTPTCMPTANDIRKAMGATTEKAEQLYNEFADYSSQRLSE